MIEKKTKVLQMNKQELYNELIKKFIYIFEKKFLIIKNVFFHKKK
jgi:hypothetical protein